jgi:hypothetical protein
MRKIIQKQLCVIFLFPLFFSQMQSQGVTSKNSISLEFSGRVQLQHLYAPETQHREGITLSGFRIRRGRFQVNAKITPYLCTKFQVEARDNSPRLKDAEGKLKLFTHYYVRFGQFKVPVWREEFLRSSSDLILVERSSASTFLIVNLLSARQIGAEVGGQFTEKFSFAFNYSNGSGEGNSEIAVLEKLSLKNGSVSLLNDGKMYAGRLDYYFNGALQVGISGVINDISVQSDTINQSGQNTLIAPDIGIYLPNGIDIEAGVGYGEISKNFFQIFNDQTYFLVDLTGRWKKFYKKENAKWGGLSGFELTAGVSHINTQLKTENEELSERTSVRFGPGVYFGKKSRLQINGEFTDTKGNGKNNFWRIRSQFTVNF